MSRPSSHHTSLSTLTTGGHDTIGSAEMCKDEEDDDEDADGVLGGEEEEDNEGKRKAKNAS